MTALPPEPFAPKKERTVTHREVYVDAYLDPVSLSMPPNHLDLDDNQTIAEWIAEQKEAGETAYGMAKECDLLHNCVEVTFQVIEHYDDGTKRCVDRGTWTDAPAEKGDAPFIAPLCETKSADHSEVPHLHHMRGLCKCRCHPAGEAVCSPMGTNARGVAQCSEGHGDYPDACDERTGRCSVCWAAAPNLPVVDGERLCADCAETWPNMTDDLCANCNVGEHSSCQDCPCTSSRHDAEKAKETP